MVIKRSLIVFLLCASTEILFGQNESEVAEFQRLLSGSGSKATEKALAEAQLRIEQAQEIRDGREEVKATRDIGLIYLNNIHDYERALDLFIKSLAISDSLRLEDQQVLTFISIARVFEVVSDYYKSAQFLEQALELNRDQRNINVDALILNSLGRVNASRGMLQEALQNYQKVLRYKDDINKTYEAEALFNLGHLFTLQGDYSGALDYHRMALRVHRSTSNSRAEATSLNDIGVLYGLMKNDEKSQANHQVALEIRQRLGDRKGIAESMNNIAAFHLKENRAEDAIDYSFRALEYGRESQAREQMLRSYDLLSQAYKIQGDFRNALEYKELGVAIQEFIQSEKQERQLLETQNRYVVETKESEIQKLDALRVEREREIAAQRKFRNILFLVVVLIFMTAGLLLVLYLVKRRSNLRLQAARREVEAKNKKLEDLNQTKDKFFSIISHDLKGPLNSLTSFSRLLIDHTESMTKEEIQLLAKDLDKSVKNLLTLLENLLEWSRSQTGNIDFSAEEFSLSELFSSNRNLLQGQAASKGIQIEVVSPAEMMVRLHKNSINTVVRNLMSNAIKFTPEGGSIRVGANMDQGVLKISVADTGVGMTKDVMDKLFRLGSKHSTVGTSNEKGTGLGLILCREFVEKNGGQISVASAPGKGSVFTCVFPKSVVVPSPHSLKKAQVSF